jgi:hypothetical protein
VSRVSGGYTYESTTIGVSAYVAGNCGRAAVQRGSLDGRAVID